MNSGDIIRLSKSCIGDAEKRAVLSVLDREYLGMGAEVEEFEKQLTDFFGRPAVCVANGTAALHLALQGCGVGPGDEVLVQSLTYVASFQAISATGARPIACDIDSTTLTLDWHDAEKRLTPKTKAVMPVHYSGGVGALEKIYAFAHKHGLRVIEDAAHAFGTIHKGRRVGGFGDIACFSFDGIKNITSGEGGCIVSADPKVLQRVRDARLLGVEKDTENRYAGKRSWEIDVREQGWRYHMSNVMAAIGIEQMKKISDFSKKRRELAQIYDGELKQLNWVTPLPHDYQQVVPHIYVVSIEGMRDRGTYRSKLEARGVQTGVHYQPNHLLSFYNETQLTLPNTDSIYPLILTLPLHPDMTDGDVLRICSVIREIHEEI